MARDNRRENVDRETTPTGKTADWGHAATSRRWSGRRSRCSNARQPGAPSTRSVPRQHRVPAIGPTACRRDRRQPGQQPAFVMPHWWAFEGARARAVPQHRQLHILKAHVGSMPIGPVAGAALEALGRAGGSECRCAGEVCLADERCIVAMVRERASESRSPHMRIEIHSVIPHAVGKRQQSGQNRCPRRLAYQVRRDARGKARTLRRQQIDVGCLDIRVLETEAISALLV